MQLENSLPRHFRSIDLHPSTRMMSEDCISTLAAFSKFFASRWTQVKRFTTPNDSFFSIAYGLLASDPAAPGRPLKFNIEGCLWAGSVGFEVVMHSSMKHPARVDNYIRQHMHYDNWAGAPDRRATFESMDKMDQMRDTFPIAAYPSQRVSIR